MLAGHIIPLQPRSTSPKGATATATVFNVAASAPVTDDQSINLFANSTGTVITPTATDVANLMRLAAPLMPARVAGE